GGDLASSIAQYDGVWLRQPLETCRDVRRVTQSKLFGRHAAPDLTDDNYAGMDAYPHGKWIPILFQTLYCVDDTQPRPSCTLCVIFVRYGLSKVDQQPIPEELS